MARLAAALAFSEDRTRSAALAREAVDVARRIGDPRTLHFALSCFLAATWGPDDLAERLAVSRESTRLAGEIGGGALAEMHGALMTTLLECGDAAAADREADAYRARTALTGRRISTWYLAVRRTMSALLEGRFAEVEALAANAISLYSDRQSPNAVQYYGVQLLAIRREQGRLDEMVEPTAEFAAAYPAVPTWRATLAWVHAQIGHDDEARIELERVAAGDFDDLPRDMFWLVCLWLLADVVTHLRDARRAERLYALLLPYRDRCVTCLAAFCAGSLERSLGNLATVLGRWDDAAAHFEAATAVNERIGARPWVAHGEHDHARMLLARGGASDRAAAVERLRRAAATARALGMTDLVARVDALLADLPAARDVGPGDEAVLRPEGEYWTLAYHGTSARLRDARGLRLIALLLASPEREFSAVELAAWPAPPAAPGHGADAASAADLHVAGGDDAALPDARARAEYRAHLARLREEAEEAESFNDVQRAAEAREKIALLTEHLASAVRSGHRRRSVASERARLSVTKAIRYAIGKVERVHPALAQLLTVTVKTGSSCSYAPDPKHPVRWVL
jgi:tetratricopeptide (TPR) repeat protein